MIGDDIAEHRSSVIAYFRLCYYQMHFNVD